MLLPVVDGKTTRSITSILVLRCLTEPHPNMWQMVFTHISIEGWIIDPYVQSLFYCSHLVQVLPPNNGEVVDGNIVTSDVAVVIYGTGGFRCSVNLSPKVLDDSPTQSSSHSTLSH